MKFGDGIRFLLFLRRCFFLIMRPLFFCKDDSITPMWLNWAAAESSLWTGVPDSLLSSLPLSRWLFYSLDENESIDNFLSRSCLIPIAERSTFILLNICSQFTSDFKGVEICYSADEISIFNRTLLLKNILRQIVIDVYNYNKWVSYPS